MPPGRAWGTRPFTYERDTNIKRFIYGLAGTWSRLEAAICNALNEWFCFTSLDDMDAWALDYGIPDDCELYNQSICAKVSAGGSPSADYLMRLLETNGYVGAGRWLTGSDSEFPGVRSTFRVVIDPALSPAFVHRTLLPFPFPLGYTTRFGSPDLDQVVCMLERYVPAHCVISAASL